MPLPLPLHSSRGLAGPIILASLVGLVFLLAADHFLSPPDCAFYWAWAETPARQGNFAFSNVYERLQMPTLYVWRTPTGHLANDWPMGAGLVLLPVVMLGPAVAHAWMAFWIVAAFALWWRTAPFSLGARGLGVAATLIGTPILFYGAFGPFFSHPASFAAVTAFLVVWARTRPRRTTREWLLMGLLLGFASLVRQQNLMVGIALLAELPGWFRRPQPERPPLSALVLFGAGALLAFSPQMLTWWTLYGNPFSLPKVEEMLWMTPNLGGLLFSDFHGVLPWTPVYGLAFLGLMALATRDRILAGGLALVLGVQIYLNAANVVWWSGGSFGNRRLGDSAIVVGWAIAALWDVRLGRGRSGGHDASVERKATSPSRPFRAGVAAAVVVCCLWTLTLLLAERRGLLPLDRYVPFGDGGFIGGLARTWSEPAETMSALVRPLRTAIEAPPDSMTGLWPRVVSALLLAGGTAAVVIGSRTGLRHARRLTLPLTAMALLIAAATAVAGLRTPPLTEKELQLTVRTEPAVLWDNYIELAYYEIVRRRPARAEKAARRAVAIRPDHYSGYYYLATALRQQKRYREAGEAYGQVLKLHPDHPHAARERDAALAQGSRFGLAF